MRSLYTCEVGITINVEISDEGTRERRSQLNKLLKFS